MAMRIKTKLMVSLFLEVFMIFVLTEFAYHKIERYRELDRLSHAVYQVEKELLQLEGAVLTGDAQDKLLSLEERMESLNQFQEPEATKAYSVAVSVLSQVGKAKDPQQALAAIKRGEQELEAIKRKILKKDDSILREAEDIVRIIPLFSLVIIGIGAISTYRAIVRPLNEMSKAMREIEKGDLTKSLNIDRDDELGELAREFNRFLSWIRETFKELEKLSARVSNEASMLVVELLNTSLKNDDIKKRFAELSISSEVLANSIADVNRLIDSSSKQVERVNEETERGTTIVSRSVNDVQTLADKVIGLRNRVEELQKSSTKIQEVVETIKSIADQTNLLALNAAIEAARAGEAGRGFAVVAEEVRKLASRTVASAEEIGKIVGTIIELIQSFSNELEGRAKEAFTVKQEMAKTEEVLKSIRETVESLAEVTNNVLFSLNQQLSALDTVRDNIATINEEIEGFQQIFRKLQDRIFRTRSAIKTVHESISSFRIGELSTIVKGLELFSDWLSKLPMALENPALVDYDSSPIKSWIEQEFKKIKAKGVTDLVNELEESIEAAFRKAKEIVEAVKRGELKNSMFEELEQEASRVIETFERIVEKLRESNG